MSLQLPYFIEKLPLRAIRLLRHLLFPFYKSFANEFPPISITEWISDTSFYFLDILSIPDIYQLLMQLFKWNTRKMTEQEIALGYQIFGSSIRYDLVRVDATAKFGTKKIAVAYVSFNTINYNKKIKKEIFIHELVHIWQYQRFGSIYVARAIKAQRSKEGYEYGGAPNLYVKMLQGAKLTDFNFEQQADIIEDYYKIILHPEKASALNLSIYQYYAAQLSQI